MSFTFSPNFDMQDKNSAFAANRQIGKGKAKGKNLQ